MTFWCEGQVPQGISGLTISLPIVTYPLGWVGDVGTLQHGVNLDSSFGKLRAPSNIQDHERREAPVSKVKLTHEVGQTLVQYRICASSPLMASALSALQFIWAMDAEGEIFIAFEELAVNYETAQASILGSKPLPSPPPRSGYPRRKSEHVRKLGHPTILGCGNARIAGELFLDCDEETEGLIWFLNFQSGRYCVSPNPTPSQAQMMAIHKKFLVLVEGTVRMDDES